MLELPKYYTILFNGIEQALQSLEDQNFGIAKGILIGVQQKAEESFLAEEEKEERSVSEET